MTTGFCEAPCVPPCSRKIKASRLCSGHAERRRLGMAIDTPLRAKFRARCLTCAALVKRSGKQFCCRGCFVDWQRHHPNDGTFMQGGRTPRQKLVGTERIQVDVNGHLRVFVKVAEPRRWRPRAVVVWESVNGPLPHGFIVHHENRDTLDDHIGNLVALTRSEHIKEHRHELKVRS